jgi:hypothetical protein
MENILDKFIENPNRNYSDLEKYEIKTNILNKYGNNHIQELNKISPLHTINFLKFCGIENPNKVNKFDLVKEIYLKSSKEFRIKSGDASTTTEKFYENILKLNVDKNLIVSSQKEYGNLKEGITVKKQPYDKIYVVNIYWIVGNVDIVVESPTSKKGYVDKCVQKSMMLYLTSLPNNVKDMVDTILTYEYIQKNTKGVVFHTDLYTKTAYNVFNKKKALKI